MGRQHNGHPQRRERTLRIPCASLRPGYKVVRRYTFSWVKLEAYAGLIKCAAYHLEQSRTGRTNACSPSLVYPRVDYDQDPFSDVDLKAALRGAYTRAQQMI